MIQKYDVSVLEAIYHVVEHFAMHTGQIIFATKMVTGVDLGFYRHLRTTAAHGEKCTEWNPHASASHRGTNPSRHLQVLKPAGEFRVTMRGSQFVIDARSYDRFAPIAAAAASIDAQSAGQLYRSFKPLLQTAYDELGVQEPIDSGVERAIVDLLKVPAIDGDVRVEQAGEGIGYEYADGRLESLSGAQKQLLRMGPKNIRIIQSQLRTFAMTIGIPVSRLN